MHSIVKETGPAAGRVLIVDDDANLRRMLSMRLEAAGYDVTAASSGEQACELLPTCAPQLVITDLRMPGIDGISLLQTLHQQHPGLPVAIISAHGDIPDAVRATQAGLICARMSKLSSKFSFLRSARRSRNADLYTTGM